MRNARASRVQIGLQKAKLESSGLGEFKLSACPQGVEPITSWCAKWKSAGSAALGMLIAAIFFLLPALAFTILFFIPEDSCGAAPTNSTLAAAIAAVLEIVVSFLLILACITYSNKTDGARGNSVLSLCFYGVIAGGILMGISAIVHLTFATCARDVRSGASDGFANKA